MLEAYVKVFLVRGCKNLLVLNKSQIVSLHPVIFLPIENFNRRIRKITKNKGSFPADDSLFKILYLIVNEASEKWTMPLREVPFSS